MARKFIVIAGSVHSDTHQKCFKAREIVSEDDFRRGHADQLVKDGYLKEWNEDDAVAETLKITGEESLPDVTLPPPNDAVQPLDVSLSVAKLEELVNSCEDLEVLNATLQAEEQGSNRKTAKEAITNRITELETAE